MTSEVTQAALEPCPWCKGTATVATLRAAGLVWAQVSCDNEECSATGPCADTEPEAIAAWNTRLTAQSGEGISPPTQRMAETLGARFVISGEGRSGAGEDWVSHDGGDCPVDPAATVEIKLRDGSVTTMAAKAVNWRYGTYIFEAHRTMPAFCEVVAYRLRSGEA